MQMFLPRGLKSPDTSERNDEKMKHKINLQLLAEGGASTSAGGSEAGSESSGAVTGGMDVPGSNGDDLSNLEFGISLNQEVANPETEGGDNTTKTQPTEAELQKTFDEMIKKGGQWHDQFDKRTQDMIDKRFYETKKLEATLDSHNEILGLLAAKYGVDASDSAGTPQRNGSTQYRWQCARP